jgi:hypothetical protein
MNLEPRFTATAIGSLPHPEPARAVEIVLRAIPEAPIWPQLPKRNFREQMEIQYSEGMPRVVLDEAKARMSFDTSGDYSEDLARFYEGYMAAEESGKPDAGAITPAYAAGIPALEDALKKLKKKVPFVKCQTTGPLSFALTIVDGAKRAIFYNEEFVDAVVKGLALKCRWQIRRFKPYAERGVICFVDEPILSAFGSSTYVSVQREDVVAKLGEVIGAIHAEGGISGMHCCGNTEWSIPVDAGVQVVNFDAFQFGETVALYPEHMRRHLIENRNALAWGIVPTGPAIRDVTPTGLVDKFEGLADNLAKKAGIDKGTIARQAFVTPSCGTGSMDRVDAERVFDILRETSAALRKRYGF